MKSVTISESSSIEKSRSVRIEQYAQIKGVSRYTVRNWIRDKVIPAIKIRKSVLIPFARAEEALEQFARKAQGEK
jgi:excisionase family DNA binding protein